MAWAGCSVPCEEKPVFLLFVDAPARGINVYLDLISHQKHSIHRSLASAGLNEALQFLQEKLKPQDFSPRGERQEVEREHNLLIK